MATVDIRVTVTTTTTSVPRSRCLSRGSTAAMTSAADAPQMATAAPDNSPWARVRPSRRASNRPQANVLTTATTPVSAVVQPSPAICIAVVRAPSSPTPRGSSWRAQHSSRPGTELPG